MKFSKGSNARKASDDGAASRSPRTKSQESASGDPKIDVGAKQPPGKANTFFRSTLCHQAIYKQCESTCKLVFPNRRGA